MLIIDQLKKNDPQLRAVALMVLIGLLILLGGLWWVQIISNRQYQNNLETQSFRTIRVPAIRGSILDRNGMPLAENRPAYHVSLYLEELRPLFKQAYDAQITTARAEIKQRVARKEAELGRSLNKKERKDPAYFLGSKQINQISLDVRYAVASNVVYQVGRVLRLPLALDRTDFERHYLARLALPYTVVRNLTPEQIARFEEQPLRMPGLDIEVQSTRTYPHNGTAAHIVGALRRDDSSTQGEESFFSYRMADYRGELGVEWGFDRYLRGVAGAKSVLVNNVGYRQTEHVWSEADPGSNVVLTVDMRIQEAAERALHRGPQGVNTAGAVVVMDVNTGDILAMVSSPTLNPNHYIQGFPRGEWKRITDIHAQKNRATQENYAPGSIFKTIVGLAALENGLDPHATVTAVANPRKPSASLFMLGKRGIRDTAPPGSYDFRRAMKLSSNTYFITQGLRTGPEKIIELARKFHLGERAGLATRQETSGYIPPLDRVRTRWTDGNTANLSIGQDPVLVTPLQIAVMTAAIANGGKVLWPRLVQRVEPVDPFSEQRPIEFPAGRVRDTLGVKQRSMAILHQAMLADTEDSDGTGRHVRDHVPLEGFRVCAKTGTAQVQDENNAANGQTTWFAAFGPFEKPRYAVIVMVENGASGGGTCAPIAGLVFDALLAAERPATDFRASLEGKEAGS